MSGGTGFGITPQGFVMPQISDLETQLEQALVNQFGANINLAASSFFGQFVGITAERLGLVWQAMQDVYNSQSPDTAFGASLDNVGALRGIPRLQATASTIQNVRLFGIAGTPIPSGTQFSVQNSPLSVFATTSLVTLAAGQSCVQTFSFSAVAVAGNWSVSLNGSSSASLNFNATASQVQTAIQALNFASGCTVTGNMTSGFTVMFNGAGTGGFMVQPEFGIVTNTLLDSLSHPITITPFITVPGLDQANVIVAATSDGPTVANAGTLTVIVTPVGGLTNVLNTQDAFPGTFVEADNAYRARMARELQIAGAGTVEAIRSRLLQVSGVQSALVYENITDITDINGRPPHSFEAVVNGGSDSDIAETIWLAKPAGIATFGNDSFVITDSQGVQHTIFFSRPTIIDIYIIANLTIDMTYPATGDETVKELLANYINGLGQGQEVIVIPKLIAQLASVQGIQDAVLLVGTSPGPTLPDNINIMPFQQAFTQTSFITVNHV